MFAVWAAQTAHAANHLIEVAIVADLGFASFQFLLGVSCHLAAADARSVRRLRSPPKKRGEAPRRAARRNPLYRRLYAFALSPHQTINNRKR